MDVISGELQVYVPAAVAVCIFTEVIMADIAKE